MNIGIKPSELYTIVAAREKTEEFYKPNKKEIKEYYNAVENNIEVPLFKNFKYDEDLYKDYFYEALNDCKVVGVPIGKDGPIAIVYGSDRDSGSPDATMMTSYITLEDGVRLYKITVLCKTLDEIVEDSGLDELIQMYFAHEIIHTAVMDDRHGPVFTKFVKKLIKYGNKKYGGYDENPYNEMDMSFKEGQG